MTTAPEILWHYTTFEALTKIISNGSLLASDYRFLNDTSEISTGKDICFEWLENQSNTHLRNTLDRHKFRDHADDEKLWPYVISLSEAEDNLSMWRGYSGVIHSNQGVAIGFLKTDLDILINQNLPTLNVNPTTRISKCSYDVDCINAALDGFNNSYIGNTNLPAHIITKITEIIPTIKNHKFEEEREWRILVRLDPIDHKDYFGDIGGTFRATLNLCQQDLRNGETKTKFPLGIKKIMSGPKMSEKKLIEFTKIAFNKYHGSESPEVLTSEIPFV